MKDNGGVRRSDRELLAEFVQRADHAAFEALVVRYAPAVYRACLRVLRDASEAEDASQTVFVTLARKAGSLRPDGSLAAWLHATAQNVAKDTVRRRVNRRRREQAWAETELVEMAVDCSEQQADAALGFLDQALAMLNAREREAVLLRYLLGRSAKEAALLARCEPAALSKRAERGLGRLQTIFAQRGCALAAPALLALMDSEARAVCPTTVLASINAAVRAAATGAAGAAATGGTLIMAISKANLAALAAAAGLAVTGGVWLFSGSRAKPEAEVTAVAAQPPPAQPVERAARTAATAPERKSPAAAPQGPKRDVRAGLSPDRAALRQRILGELRRGDACDWRSVLRDLDTEPSLLNEAFEIGDGVVRTPLSAAAGRAPLWVLEHLLKSGADPTKKASGLSPLAVTLEERETEVAGAVGLMLANGAPAGPEAESGLFNRLAIPFSKPFNADREEAAALLLAAGADLNRGTTPMLFYACYRDDDKRYLDWLLENGALVDARAPDGSTALLAVCQHGRQPVQEASVRRLLAAGADPNAADQDGKTPLLALLARHGALIDDAVVRLLLDAGAEASAATPNNYTLVHALAASGRCELLEECLREGGASPSVATVEGLTPAMAAVKAGRVDALRVLLAHGAALDLDAVYPDGRTVREWARDSGVPQMAEWFEGLAKQSQR